MLTAVGLLFTGFFAGALWQIPRPPFAQKAEITFFEPSTPIRVVEGEPVSLAVTFLNSGDALNRFNVGYTLFGADGKRVAEEEKLAFAEVGQNDHVVFSAQRLLPGRYWVQFGVWSVSPTRRLLVKFPSPAVENVIVSKKILP